MPIITGTDNPDVIIGTLGDDTIVGMSGDDSILAGRGDNIIFGNRGNDILRAGRGRDTLLGGRDNDQLFGNEQDNILSGDIGDDTLFAVDGENILFGNDSNDVLVGGLGNDLLYGGQANDTLWAERGNNLVSGDRGADVLIGGTGENIFVVNINQGGPNIEDADQILRFKANDKIALLGGPEGQTVDESAINIAFIRREANSTRGDFVLSNLATGEFLAVIRNVRRSTLTNESFTEDLTLSDTPDPGPPQPPVVDPEDELPPAPDPGDTTTDPQEPPTDGPGTPPVIEPPVDEEPGEGEPGDGGETGTGDDDTGTGDDDTGTGDDDTGTGDDDTGTGDDDTGTGDDDTGTGDDDSSEPDNRPPTVSDDSISLKQGRTKEGQVSGNDDDDDDITFSLEDAPGNGTVTLNADGSFTYQPNVPAFAGTDSFTFVANDGELNSETGTINVTVEASSAPFIDLETTKQSLNANATFVENQTGRFNLFGTGNGQVNPANFLVFDAEDDLETIRIATNIVSADNSGTDNTEKIEVSGLGTDFQLSDDGTISPPPRYRITLKSNDTTTTDAVGFKTILESLEYVNTSTVGNRPTVQDRIITFEATDADGNDNISEAVTLTLEVKRNESPEIQEVTSEILETGDTSSVSPFSDVVIHDPDTQGNSESVTVEVELKTADGLANAAVKGVLSGGGFTETDTDPPGTGIYSFTGTPEAATTAINNLEFNPTDNRVAVGDTETVTFEIRVDDQINGVVTNADTQVESLSINDAPQFAVGMPNPLPSISANNQDSNGSKIKDILGGGSLIIDVDDSSQEGIAVIGVGDSNGDWQYRLEGDASWFNFGTIEDNQALLLRDDDRIRFVPSNNFSDDPTVGIISFLAWDRTVGAAGETFTLPATLGPETAFSTEEREVGITVNTLTAQNDNFLITETTKPGSRIPITAFLQNDTFDDPSSITISIGTLPTGLTEIGTGLDRFISVDNSTGLDGSTFNYTLEEDGKDSTATVTISTIENNDSENSLDASTYDVALLQGDITDSHTNPPFEVPLISQNTLTGATEETVFVYSNFQGGSESKNEELEDGDAKDEIQDKTGLVDYDVITNFKGLGQPGGDKIALVSYHGVGGMDKVHLPILTDSSFNTSDLNGKMVYAYFDGNDTYLIRKRFEDNMRRNRIFAKLEGVGDSITTLDSEDFIIV